MTNLKMYILVKDSVPIGLGVNAVGHAALATYLHYSDSEDMKEWLETSFKKVTCKVTDEQFKKAKTYEDGVIITENALIDDNGKETEVALGFKPRNEWPEFFKSLKLYK